MTSRLTTELVRRGILSSQEIEIIQRSPALRGKLFALRLHISGAVDEELVFGTLLDLGSRDATAELAELPPPRVLALVPSRLAEDGCLVPFGRTGGRLHVAMLDPSDERAIEDLALFTGLAVEPFVARPRALFRALFDAYRVPPPTPLAHFDLAGAQDAVVLPPPREVALPAVGIRTASSAGVRAQADLQWEDPPHSEVGAGIFGDGDRSPLLSSLASLDPGELIATDEPTPAPRVDRADVAAGPGAPRVAGWDGLPPVQDRVEGWQMSGDDAALAAARQSLPSQLLPTLAAHFAHVALFEVRQDLAVGWDGAGHQLTSQRIRDVLLPLTPPSTLRLAYTTRQAVAGDPERLDAIDRILLGFLGAPAPRQWLVLPVLGQRGVQALLYVDRAESGIDDAGRGLADAAAAALGDSLEALRQRFGDRI